MELVRDTYFGRLRRILEISSLKGLCAHFLIKTVSFAKQICLYEQLSMPTWLTAPDKALKETVQSSPLELETALTALKAVRVEPASEECGSEAMWFVLEPDYHMRALSMMCNFCEENDWKWFRYGPTRAICLVNTLWCRKRAMWLSFRTLLSLGQIHTLTKCSLFNVYPWL